MMNTMTPSATIERTQVKPLASENAAPEFVDEVQLQELAEQRDEVADLEVRRR